MKGVLFFVGVLIGLGLAALFHWGHTRKAPRSRLFVSDSAWFLKGEIALTNPIMYRAAFDHTDDIHQSCPQAAFVSSQEKSDYSLAMFWDKDHWQALLQGDDQLLLRESSPDFNKIVRDACRAMRKNEDWPTRPLRNKKDVLLDRYELHDLRIGPVATSALIDKQTGKIWVWNKTKTGTAFFSEQVFPQPGIE